MGRSLNGTLTGYRLKDLLGRPVRDLVPEAGHAKQLAWIAAGRPAKMAGSTGVAATAERLSAKSSRS